MAGTLARRISCSPTSPMVLCCAALTGLIACGASDSREVPTETRGIVLISIDTARADRFGVYGDPGDATPHIDELAQDGTVFDHAVAPAAFTQPSHASLLTGLDPVHHGVRSNTGYRLGDSHRTLAEILQAEGFSTHAVVATEVLDPMFGFDQGFDSYDAGRILPRPNGDRVYQYRPADEIAAAASAILEREANDRFFLFLHFYDVHTPLRAPEPFRSRYPDDDYQAEVAYVDAAIGRVVAQLERLGIGDSTAILLTADHGEALGGHGERTHGYFIYQDTLRVPLIIRAPGLPAAPRVERVAGLVDVVPTVLELLEISPRSRYDGTSLVPYLRGERPDVAPRTLYAEAFLPTQFGRAPLFGLVGDRWKYIHTTRPELYDLASDPAEADDRLDRETAIADRLEAQLRERARSERARPAPADHLQPPDPETAERLAALGYVTGVAVDDRLDLDTSKPDPKDFVSTYLTLMRAQSHVIDFELEEAETLLDEALSEHPDLAFAHLNKGKVAIRRRKWDEAIAHLERRLALAPEPPPAIANAAGLQRPGSQPQYLWELAEVHDLVGFAYAATQRFAEAEAHFRKSLALYPNHVERRLHLADTLYAIESAQAADAYRRVLDLEPDHAKAKKRLEALATP